MKNRVGTICGHLELNQKLILKVSPIQKNDFKKVALCELGPRFTLRLRSLQKGTFDSKYGEFEFELRRKEMDTEGHGFAKTKFFL